MMDFPPTKVSQRRPRVHYLVEVTSSKLPSNINEHLEPYIELIGKPNSFSQSEEWTRKQYLTGSNIFCLDKPAKFRFEGNYVGNVDRLRIGVDNKIEGEWVIERINLKIVNIKNGKVVDIIASHVFENEIRFSQNFLVREEPVDLTNSNEQVSINVMLTTDKMLSNCNEYEVRIYSKNSDGSSRSTGKFVLFKCASMYPLKSDKRVVCFTVSALDPENIESIEFHSGGRETFQLKSIQLHVNDKRGTTVTDRYFITNYDFFPDSKPVLFLAEHDETIEYEIYFKLFDLTTFNLEDKFNLKIFNETDFVELEVKHFTRLETNEIKFRCESKVH